MIKVSLQLFESFKRWRHAGALALVLVLAWAPVGVVYAQSPQALALKAQHAARLAAMSASPFQRPLVLESIEHDDRLQGDIYAQIDLPFSLVGPALRGIDSWCDILILHLDVKQCSAIQSTGGASLGLDIGKRNQPLLDAYRLELAYKALPLQPDYLRVEFEADQGPMGTSDYLIVIEAVALDAQRSFLRMSYGYRYGTMARIAMQGYLATAGRSKIGFSVVGRTPDGKAEYVRGMRGVVERNTMRYYLAVEAYLGALSLPAAQRFERRLADWFSGTERHAAQLHELERDEYLALKRGRSPGRSPAQARGG